MKTRVVALSTVALAAILAPPAMGAAVFPERTCLREGGPARFLGTGYGPGQPVAASLDGRQFVTGTADELGRVPLVIFALPQIGRSEDAG